MPPPSPTELKTVSPPPADERRVRKTTAVLHVINGEHYSGAERVQDLLALRMPEFGFQLRFACLKDGEFAARRQSRSPLVVTDMASRLDLRPAWRLAQRIRDEQIGLVHAHTPRSAMVASLASVFAGVPLVYHVHSPTRRDSTNKLRNLLNTSVERASLWRASQLICVSSSLARQMRREGIPQDRISVVRNGVPAPAKPPQRNQPVGDWTIGTVALFRPRKGTEVLIDALARLRKQGYPVRLRTVGPFETPEYESLLKGRVEQHGLHAAVEWTGFTSDVHAQLAGMDLFCLPSLFGEGLPMVVLEAMASGLPIVATRVEGVPEAVRHGREGVLAPPADADALADAIAAIIEGRYTWRKMSELARQRHAEAFSDMSMAAGLARVYRRLLEG